MKRLLKINKKIILLRNLLFLYYNLTYDIVEAVDTDAAYFRFDIDKYKSEDFPLLHDTIEIESSFCQSDKNYISKDELIQLNGIYRVIKNHKSVIKYIEENGKEG